jgi:aspartate aminotransferase-like enzyme
MREHVEQWVASHERCGILAPEGHRADTVTALTMPPGRSAETVAGELAQHGWQVAVGIDEDQDRLLRIGHMGDVTVDQLDRLLEAIKPLL